MPIEQACPHVPQFLAALITSKQPELPQSVWPGIGHVQVPALHVDTGEHACEHDPQFAVLLIRFLQEAPQGLKPGPHVQTPRAQVPPVPQSLPHSPQLLRSVSKCDEHGGPG